MCETDMELDLLAYWKLKESTWPKLAKMAKLAIPGGALLVGRRRARLLGRREDARRPAQVGEGQHPRALALCGLQHRLMRVGVGMGQGQDVRGYITESPSSVTC